MASAVTGLELLLIYVLSRISRVLMNRELKAANVVFCQALFPKKSVRIPFFQQGNFPAFGGH